ncbi:MAG: hypothetical protein ACE5HA_02855 [Anaerolineae bacterium]
MQESPSLNGTDVQPDQTSAIINTPTPQTTMRRSLRNFAIGIAIYSLFIIGYIFVLRQFSEPLLRLYTTRSVVYALVALALVVVQGLVLESITTFLAEHLGIVTHEE